MTVEHTELIVATCSDTYMACRNGSFLKNSPYQRSESPSGGNFR
jgi:hypothetical protein